MHLYQLFTAAELADQLEKKMVKITAHPTLPLRILNYTQQAAFTPQHWNHVTDKCRGLIVDATDTVVARAFEKFWNLNDERHPETLMQNLPIVPPNLTRKMDGSLGIGYCYEGTWRIATRGSFASEQAHWASAWIAKSSPVCSWPDGYTPLFEIIYPANQIVVRYDYSGLVLLAMVEIETGEEAERPALERFASLNGIRVVESFSHNVAECAEEDAQNEEGYVAAWRRDGNTPLRVKIKYETYVRLHRMLTQTNAVTVWEMLRDGLDLTTLTADVPAEFRGWIDGLEARFTSAFDSIENAAVTAMHGYAGSRNLDDPASKKDFALYVTSSHKELAPIMFAMATGKSHKPIIWKQIRPRGDEKSFRVDEA